MVDEHFSEHFLPTQFSRKGFTTKNEIHGSNMDSRSQYRKKCRKTSQKMKNTLGMLSPIIIDLQEVPI